MYAVSPRQHSDVHVTCYCLGVPKMHSKSCSVYVLLWENIHCLLELYQSIIIVFLWLITASDPIVLICTHL